MTLLEPIQIYSIEYILFATILFVNTIDLIYFKRSKIPRLERKIERLEVSK